MLLWQPSDWIDWILLCLFLEYKCVDNAGSKWLLEADLTLRNCSFSCHLDCSHSGRTGFTFAAVCIGHFRISVIYSWVLAWSMHQLSELNNIMYMVFQKVGPPWRCFTICNFGSIDQISITFGADQCLFFLMLNYNLFQSALKTRWRHPAS